MQLITQSWSPASISAIAAVCGSLVGALGSSVGTWISQPTSESARSACEKDLSPRAAVFGLHQ